MLPHMSAVAAAAGFRDLVYHAVESDSSLLNTARNEMCSSLGFRKVDGSSLNAPQEGAAAVGVHQEDANGANQGRRLRRKLGAAGSSSSDVHLSCGSYKGERGVWQCHGQAKDVYDCTHVHDCGNAFACMCVRTTT
eukprot:5412561-Pleurochrysis_carterae.AAC.1